VISAFVTTSRRVLIIATLCWASSVASLRADPIVIASGQFATAVNGPTFYQLFGTDGFVLGGIFPLLPSSPRLTCPTVTGCAPGTIVNMSAVAGGDPTPFLGLATGAVINGTEFVPPFGLRADAPRLIGEFVFDAPTITVADRSAPFVFNGVVSGFAADDLDGLAPLFRATLTGQGIASLGFEDFDFNGALSGSSVTYTFAAATPEPSTLVLLGTGLVGLLQRARNRRRIHPPIRC
jgi:PEP-CTERM motif-containing protein